MPSGLPLVRITGGVLGGWLTIMAPAVVTIALRLRDFDESGLPTFYARTLTVGWLTLLVALILAGRLGDRIYAHLGSRVLLARVGVPLFAITGLFLALAPTPNWLLAAWIAVQIPAALVVTTALAESGDHVSVSRRGIASGLVGASAILALLLGTTLVRLTGESTTWSFLLPALLGTLFALPLMITVPDTAAPSETSISRFRGISAQQLGLLWFLFLAASFLLSWSTSTTNGFVVTFVQYVLLAPAYEISTTSTTAVILAATLATSASLFFGWLSRGGQRGPRLWVLGASLCAGALALMVLAPSPLSFLLAAAVFGVGFGTANGVELSVVLNLRDSDDHLGQDLGVFTAVTTAPYVLVPALASVLLTGDTESGTRMLFGLASCVALLGALMTLRLALRVNARAN